MKKLGHCHHFVCILCCKRGYGGKEKDAFLILYCSFVRPLIHKTIKKRKKNRKEQHNNVFWIFYMEYGKKGAKGKWPETLCFMLLYFATIN